MVFKRRDQRPLLRIVAEWVYPRGGWMRAFQYVTHRLNRLPGSAESIGRGVAAGVFAVFTPFFGFHFFIAALLAWILRGNVIASLLATFVGNPLTYVPIAIIALETGHFMLGSTMRSDVNAGLIARFRGAAGDLLHNLWSIFSGAPAHWHELKIFYDTAFFPWMIGAIIPGILSSILAYFISVPLIRAYQKRRIAKRRAKIEKRREQAGTSGAKR